MKMKTTLLFMCMFLMSNLFQISSCHILRYDTKEIKDFNQIDNTELSYFRNKQPAVKDLSRPNKNSNLIDYHISSAIIQMLLHATNKNDSNVVGDWSDCVNLSLSFFQIRKVSDALFKLGTDAGTLFTDIYTSVSKCKLHDPTDEVQCIINALESNVTGLKNLFYTAFDVLENTSDVFYKFREELVRCLSRF